MTRDGVFDRTRDAWLLLAPTLFVLTVFLYYPTIRTVPLSLYRTFLFGSRKQFVGLGNFASLATSGKYQASVLLTLAFVAVVVVGTLLVGFVVAALIFSVTRGSTAYLVAAVWPYAVPMAVAGTMFNFLLNPVAGIFTRYLAAWFGVHLNWYLDGPQAFAVVTLVAVWKQVGFDVIILYAALHTIPDSLVEVADIDGVATWRRFALAYAPLVSPTLVFLVVMNTIYAFFESFSLVDLLTAGGPNGATTFLVYKLYRDAFSYHDLGLAAAESILLFCVVVALTAVQFRFSDRYAHYGGV